MIDSFTNDCRFLSNFYPAQVKLDGVAYPTVEHAYQAAKTRDPAEREAIRRAWSAGGAKKLGQKVNMRSDWLVYRETVMEDLLRQKFSVGSALAAELLATGDEELVEGNLWSDVFWGVCRGVGENKLGKLLMKIRDELQREEPVEWPDL